MLQDHAKLVQFIRKATEVRGRKKLQKMIYIAKRCGVPFNEKYQLHMYGPYSEELTCRIEELCELGFLQEALEDKGSYVVYRYEATATGLEFAETFTDEQFIPENLIESMQSKSARFLELVSTLYYFDDLPKEAQIEKVKIVKNKLNYTDEEFEEAFVYIEELAKLVQ